MDSFPVVRQGKRVMAGRGNHWTDNGVGVITWMIGGTGLDTASTYRHSPYYNHPIIQLGSDQNIATSPTMTKCYSIISSRPDSRRGVEHVKEADGQYRSVVECVWNAYHFSSNFVIGELGLFFDSNPAGSDLGDVGDSGCGYHPCRDIDGSKMMARACVADGTLQPFSVDYTLPLVVQWVIRMTWR